MGEAICGRLQPILYLKESLIDASWSVACPELYTVKYGFVSLIYIILKIRNCFKQIIPKIIKWKSAILDQVTCREVFPDLRHCERLNLESNMNIQGLDELCLRLSGAWQIKVCHKCWASNKF